MDHPEVMKKVQLEIDTVVGLGRLPDFSDGAKLPYDLPHRLTEDDIYRAMFIPKGALSDRFLDKKDLEVLDKMAPRNYVFGFGHRHCSGADLVESSLWLLLVTMMETLDISKPIEEVVSLS
ncbi:cytochrome P450 [Mycena capillaripes]|nr:cytochrome P450 [Mycena capillaripes]